MAVEVAKRKKISPVLIIIPAALVLGTVGVVVLTRKAKAVTPPSPGLATLFGYVTDSKNASKLANVRVSLNDHAVYTDSSGMYVFTDIQPGDYGITFDKTGYKTVQTGVSVEGGLSEFDYSLEQLPTYILSDSAVIPTAYWNDIFDLSRFPFTEVGQMMYGGLPISDQPRSFFYARLAAPLVVNKPVAINFGFAWHQAYYNKRTGVWTEATEYAWSPGEIIQFYVNYTKPGLGTTDQIPLGVNISPPKHDGGQYSTLPIVGRANCKSRRAGYTTNYKAMTYDITIATTGNPQYGAGSFKMVILDAVQVLNSGSMTGDLPAYSAT
jgi:hypothetical protein